MFSKELENLIQATLEDGVLEEYEKAALIKRAQAKGVDLTELEIYINSILQKRQKELDNDRNAKIEQYNQQKRQALGRVCPICGSQVPPMTLKCDCGFEFTDAKSSSSVQLLLEKIEEINYSKGMMELSASEREKRICEAIEMFPIPNTKEDILEFSSMAVSHIKNNKVGFFNTYNGRIVLYTIASIVSFGWFLILALFLGWFKKLDESEGVLKERRWNAWKSKFGQLVLKGRSLHGDPDFQKQLDYYESQVKK